MFEYDILVFRLGLDLNGDDLIYTLYTSINNVQMKLRKISIWACLYELTR